MKTIPGGEEHICMVEVKVSNELITVQVIKLCPLKSTLPAFQEEGMFRRECIYQLVTFRHTPATHILRCTLDTHILKFKIDIYISPNIH